jgi:nitrite reductase/ring-hydroxylating ferredoxin subunit
MMDDAKEDLIEADGWVKLFDTEAESIDYLPINQMQLIEVKGLLICLAQTRQGLGAIADACPHLGASLSRGKCNAWGEVVCPWHSYRFDLTTGEETTRNGYQARTFPIKANASGVYIQVI